jgi:photosystem II stability/assembly factor-like uncharacterized protein
MPRRPALVVLAAVSCAVVWPPPAPAAEWRPSGIWHPPQASVLALAADPRDPEVVYAGTLLGGLLKTDDGGATWRSVAGNVPLLVGELVMQLGSDVAAISVSPWQSSDVLAATAHAGVVGSANGGASWRPLNAGLAGRGEGDRAFLIGALSVAHSPAAPGKVYIGLRGRGAFSSDDGGRRWHASRGLGRADVTALAAHPWLAAVAWAGTLGRGVFRTDDGGRRWRPAGPSSAGRLVTALAAEPLGATVVYAGTVGGVYTSVDGGRTWRRGAGVGGRAVYAVVCDPVRAGFAYAGTAAGVYRTADGGRHWRRLGTLPSAPVVEALAVGADGGRLYAGTRGAGVFVLDLNATR